MKIRRANAGQKMRIRALDWNAIAEQTERLAQLSASMKATDALDGAETDQWFLNTTGRKLKIGDVVWLDDTVKGLFLLPQESSGEGSGSAPAYVNPCAQASLNRAWALSNASGPGLNPVVGIVRVGGKENVFVRVAFVGLAVCKVNVIDNAHLFATIDEDAPTDRLKSSETGTIRILKYAETDGSGSGSGIYETSGSANIRVAIVFLAYPNPASELLPFELYVRDGKWRVRHGVVDDIEPDNDDAAGTPLKVEVAANTTHYFWLEQSWRIGDGGSGGGVWNPYALTIAHGTSLWSGYPAQDAGSPGDISTPPTPPETFRIYIGKIVADSEGNATRVQALRVNPTTAVGMNLQDGDEGVQYVLQIGRTS